MELESCGDLIAGQFRPVKREHPQTRCFEIVSMGSNDRGVLGQCHPAPIGDITHPIRVVHRLIRAVWVHIGHHVRDMAARTQHLGDVVAAETAVEEELERG